MIQSGYLLGTANQGIFVMNATRSKQDRPDSARLRHADQLAAAQKLDLKDWFTPTADNYFSRVGKQQILDAITEASGQPHAPWKS